MLNNSSGASLLMRMQYKTRSECVSTRWQKQVECPCAECEWIECVFFSSPSSSSICQRFKTDGAVNESGGCITIISKMYRSDAVPKRKSLVEGGSKKKKRRRSNQFCPFFMREKFGNTASMHARLFESFQVLIHVTLFLRVVWWWWRQKYRFSIEIQKRGVAGASAWYSDGRSAGAGSLTESSICHGLLGSSRWMMSRISPHIRNHKVSVFMCLYILQSLKFCFLFDRNQRWLPGGKVADDSFAFCFALAATLANLILSCYIAD